MRVVLVLSALAATCAGLQLNAACAAPRDALACASPALVPVVRPRSGDGPRCQFGPFGGGPKKGEQGSGGLTRENEPDDFFATNMGEHEPCALPIPSRPPPHTHTTRTPRRDVVLLQ